MSPPRGKYWCFTVNNYTETEYQQLTYCVDSNSDVSYIIFGKETGDTGTKHLQGYIELVNKLRLGGVKLIAGLGRAHLETRKGTQQQAIEYCEKDGEIFTDGNPAKSSQGKRKDLESIKELLDDGKTQLDIATEYFPTWCRNRKSFLAYNNLRAKRVARDVRVMVLHGDAGTGKTRIIFENEPELYIAPSDKLQWFDGYEGEPAILIDDYRGEADSSFLLRFMDRYPIQLPVKGGYVSMSAVRIYFTSNVEPVAWQTNIDVAPLLRRIHYERRFRSPIYGDDWTQEERVNLWKEISGEQPPAEGEP